MKLSRITFSIFIISSVAVSVAFSQKNSNTQSEQKPVRVIANLMVLDAEGKFVNDVKREDIKVFEDNTEQKISYFSKKDGSLNLGFVADNSGSMRYQLERVAFIGRTITANLRSQDEAFFIRFVSQDKIVKIQDWTSDKDLLKKAFDEMYAEGGQSALIDGLYLSTQKVMEREKTDTSKRNVLILISDGEDRDSYYKVNQLFDLLKDSDLQIFPIILFNDLPKRVKEKSRDFANNIALETGGTAFFRDKKQDREEIINALKSVVTELRSQYIIGYTSTNQKRDGLSRSLRVEIADGENGEKRTGIIRENFVVPTFEKSK